MKHIKAVIFDLDGTLADTLADLAASANYALKALGYPEHEVEEYRYFVGNGIPVMLRRASGAGDDPDAVQRLREKFMEHYRVHFCDNTSVYSGMPDAVLKLREWGIKTAVVTNKADSMAKTIVEKLYPGLFDMVVGQIDGVPCKPDPKVTLSVMSKLGVIPGECVFLGDSDADMQTALNCGAYGAGALWGFRTREELLCNGAKSLLESPDKLVDLIKSIND